jgi:hypothetical protein
MYETDNGIGPPARSSYRLPERGPLRDLSLYEDLIADGVATANSQGGVIDHVTARRMALWLVAQQQPPDFARGLIRFAQSGAVTRALKLQLANYARSPGFPHRSKAARLREYTVARGTDLGPVGIDFGAICDQIDQADAMLAGLRERTREGRGTSEPTRPDTASQQPLALARRDPGSRTVTLVLDAATADIAMFAIAAHADEREAHVREVERSGCTLPEDSYGRRNRQDIAAHETRVAARLRAVEQAYRTVIDHDTAYRPPDFTRTPRTPERHPGRQSDLEAEP